MLTLKELSDKVGVSEQVMNEWVDSEQIKPLRKEEGEIYFSDEAIGRSRLLKELYDLMSKENLEKLSIDQLERLKMYLLEMKES